MNLNRRALRRGIVIVAAVTLSLATASAAAESGGHFVISEAHSVIHVTEKGNHEMEFRVHPMEGGIICDETEYTGTVSMTTVTEIDLKPSYKACHTTGSVTTFPIHANGCTWRMTVGKGTEQTVDLICPSGNSLVITHPNCTITYGAQTSAVGATYTPTTDEGTHKLTVDAELEFAVQFHGGICVFLGTSHIGTLEGTMTVNADTTGPQTLDLTAT